MAQAEHHQLDFPGFLRADDGRDFKHDDVLAFVAGAARATAGLSDADRARARRRRQGVKAEMDGSSPAEVSRLIAAGQKAILAKHGRRHGGLPGAEDVSAPPDLAGEGPQDD